MGVYLMILFNRTGKGKASSQENCSRKFPAILTFLKIWNPKYMAMVSANVSM